MPTDEERFEETKRLMEEAFEKAELARQPELKRLQEQKRQVDERIHEITVEIVWEVLGALRSRAEEK